MISYEVMSECVSEHQNDGDGSLIAMPISSTLILLRTTVILILVNLSLQILEVE